VNTGIHGRAICIGITALLVAGTVCLAAERTPLKERLPKAGEAIPLVEGFPLLKHLLELKDPWQLDVLKLKDEIFPKPMEFAWGTKEHPILFVDRRFAADHRKPENNVHSLHREDTIHRRKK
jgi:hypothetical protein